MKSQNYLILFLLAALSSCTANRMLTTREGLQPGQELLFRQSSTNETTLEDPNTGEPIVVLSSEIRDESYTVRTVAPDGGAEMEVRLLRFRKTETKNGVATHYDSAEPDPDSADLTAQMYRSMVNFPYRVRVQSNGLIGQLIGFDSLFNTVLRKLPDTPESAMLAKGLRAQFNDEAFKNQVSGIWSQYPARRVRVGKQWKQNTRQASFGINQETLYKLVQLDSASARIQMDIRLKSDPENPYQFDLGVFTMSYALEGKGAGVMEVDQPLALMRRMEQSYELDGFVRMKIQFLPEQVIPMQTKIRQVIERIQ